MPDRKIIHSYRSLPETVGPLNSVFSQRNSTFFTTYFCHSILSIFRLTSGYYWCKKKINNPILYLFTCLFVTYIYDLVGSHSPNMHKPQYTFFLIFVLFSQLFYTFKDAILNYNSAVFIFLPLSSITSFLSLHFHSVH